MMEFKLFLASSLVGDLGTDRIIIGDFIRRLNKLFEKKGIVINLFKCEDFDVYYQGCRTQDVYNREIADSKMFIALFHKSAGEYTLEEFNIAVDLYKAHKFPKIYVYFRDFNPDNPNKELVEIQNYICGKLGHFVCSYQSKDTLCLHLLLQILHVMNLLDRKSFELHHSTIFYDGLCIANLNDVSFARLDSEYNRLYTIFKEAEQHLRLKEGSADNISSSCEYNGSDNNYQTAKQNFENYQKQLLELALRFSELRGNSLSQRVIQARELFFNGKVKEANRMLDLEEMNDETQKELALFEQYKKQLSARIEEYQLKVQTSLIDYSLTSQQRHEDAFAAYKQAIGIVKSIMDYEPYKKSYLFFQYATFLVNYPFSDYTEEASKYFQESLSIIITLTQLEPGKYDEELGAIHQALGVNCLQKEDFTNAEKYLREALTYEKKLEAKSPQRYKDNVALMLLNLGKLYIQKKEWQNALRYLRQSLSEYEELNRTTNGDFVPKISMVYRYLARVYSCTNLFDLCEENLVNARNLFVKSIQENHISVPGLHEFGDVCFNLANLYQQTGNNQQTDVCFNESLKCFRTLLDLSESQSIDREEYIKQIAQVQHSLALFYLSEGKYKKSDLCFVEAVEKMRSLALKSPLAYSSELARIINDFSILKQQTSSFKEAEEGFLEALSIRKKDANCSSQDDRFEIFRTTLNLANLYKDRKAIAKSNNMYNEAIGQIRKLSEEAPNEYLGILLQLLKERGLDYILQQSYKKAEEKLNEAVVILRELTTKNPDQYSEALASMLCLLGSNYFSLGEKQLVISSLQEAIQIYNKLSATGGKQYTHMINSINGLLNEASMLNG